MNSYSALTQLASTRDEMERFTASVIDSVKNGEVSPIKILMQLRAMEKVSEKIAEGIKENVLNEADKYEKKFSLYGNEIEKAEFATKYNYAMTGDREWEKLDAAFKTAESNRKDRETFLRSLKEPMEVLDRDTGELMVIRPPLKTSVSGLKISFK